MLQNEQGIRDFFFAAGLGEAILEEKGFLVVDGAQAEYAAGKKVLIAGGHTVKISLEGRWVKKIKIPSVAE
jgi:hypothetical protein